VLVVGQLWLSVGLLRAAVAYGRLGVFGVRSKVPNFEVAVRPPKGQASLCIRDRDGDDIAVVPAQGSGGPALLLRQLDVPGFDV
jgi:hypothetical protein